MRKAKTKTGSRKRKSATKAKEVRTPVLKERLEAEFAQAMKSAKSYVEDPQRMRALFQEAAKEAASLPRDPFKETWPYFQTMLRLVRGHYQGNYHNVDESTL